MIISTFHRFDLQRLNKKLAARDEARKNGEGEGMSVEDYPAGFRFVL